MLFLAGGLTGGAFPPLARQCDRDNTRRGAGIAFAADEAGAAVAAVLVGLVAMPWAGVSATAWALAALHGTAILAVICSLRLRSS